MFNIKAENELIATGKYFRCHACFRAMPISKQNQRYPVYCDDCWQIIVSERHKPSESPLSVKSDVVCVEDKEIRKEKKNGTTTEPKVSSKRKHIGKGGKDVGLHSRRRKPNNGSGAKRKRQVSKRTGSKVSRNSRG